MVGSGRVWILPICFELPLFCYVHVGTTILPQAYISTECIVGGLLHHCYCPVLLFGGCQGDYVSIISPPTGGSNRVTCVRWSTERLLAPIETNENYYLTPTHYVRYCWKRCVCGCSSKCMMLQNILPVWLPRLPVGSRV